MTDPGTPQAIQKATKRPDWVADKDRPTCTKCLKKFTTVRRRHHCRACGDVYCGKCCHDRIRIPELGYTTKTLVCVRCKEQYLSTGGIAGILAAPGSSSPVTSSSTTETADAMILATTSPVAAKIPDDALSKSKSLSSAQLASSVRKSLPPPGLSSSPATPPPPSLATPGITPPPSLNTPGHGRPNSPPVQPPPPTTAPRTTPTTAPRTAPTTTPRPAPVPLPPTASTTPGTPPVARPPPRSPRMPKQPPPALPPSTPALPPSTGPPPLPSTAPPPLPSTAPPPMPPPALAASSSSSQPSPLTDEKDEEKRQKRMKQRQMVVTEFVQTEEDFVGHLKIIVEKFLMPVRTKQLLPMLEMGELFSNVEIIAMSNEELLVDLKRLVDNQKEGEDLCIGKTFLPHVKNLIPIYTPYCLNQTKCVETFERVSSSKKCKAFTTYVNEQLLNPECKGLPLMSFLIKPVQRLCKYPLLLRELIKNTPADHPDYAPLNEAMKLTQSLVDEVNSSKREAENVRKMLAVTKQLSGADNLKLMMPGRRFIRDGRLVKISVHNKHQERQFTLFNDMLIYAAKTTSALTRKKYQFKGFMHLDQIDLVDVSDTDSLKNAFCLARTDSIKKKHIVYSKDPKDKADWLQKLQEAVTEAKQKRATSMGKSRLLLQDEREAQASSSSSGVAFKVVSDKNSITAAQQLQVVDVENRVSGWHNEDKNRYLIREGGPFTVKYSGSGETQRYVFLFSDSVLITNKHSAKSFSSKQFVLCQKEDLKVTEGQNGTLSFEGKTIDPFTMFFQERPQQKQWKADLLRAGAIDAAGGWGASQAAMTGQVKVVRVRMINPSLAEYGLKDTFKTLSIKPETTVAELEEQMMRKVCARIKPEDRDIVKKGCEGYHLYEEDESSGMTKRLDPESKPYGSLHQLLFRRPS